MSHQHKNKIYKKLKNSIKNKEKKKRANIDFIYFCFKDFKNGLKQCEKHPPSLH